MKKIQQKKMFSGAILTVVTSAMIVTGCGGNNTNNSGGAATNAPTNAPTEAASPSPETKVSGSVTVAGSTSVQPLAEELGTAYMGTNGDARIEVSGGGSGAGVKAAQAGTADIGMASRAIKDDETGIEPIVIAIDGIAVVANSANEVENLTVDQVKGIFSGQIKNWSEVGGKDGNIVVINREEGSGTRDAFGEIVLGEEPFVAEAIIQNSTGAVREAVSQDANAIGYISTGGLNDSVKAVKVDEHEPTEENIKSGLYPIQRPFNFLVGDSKDPSAVAQAFIDYVLSDAGQAIVAENGYVTVK
ncbi:MULTISPECIES: phosphate ABC transporter substrate-binding protein [Paenibacillus]|uniref:Phosphate-binding protein n=1 Tax=Paenibacillus agaridevorans TaxID=171404 RepID=A0A2R5EWI1_9BACL|nr:MULTISPECIES: phosphate ABC transporter substrate-binding protein [Paenibacillus]QNK55946.1 phosphate ABC transporter substrate-binding protein [Paenibacillus sp. PAMC21692]GBG07744.1 putative phosphate-binding protein [Paenibacillus agaridevorans]